MIVHRITVSGDDMRFVDITGREKRESGKDGDVRFEVDCPFCGEVCMVHFSLSGSGSFVCRGCGSIGEALHGEWRGKRYFQLTAQGDVDISNERRAH